MESEEGGKKEESAEQEETSQSPQENKEQSMSSASSAQQQQSMKTMDDKANNVSKQPQPSPSFLTSLQMNPLLINLILEKTLSNLPLKDLLSCRLVCKEWNRVSTPKVKEKSEIILSAVDLTPQDPRGGTRLNNHFLETMKNSFLSLPSTKFQLRFHPFNLDLSPFQGLIDLCPTEITSLHLTSSENFGVPTWGPNTNTTTFQNWMRVLKNLTKLTLTDYYFSFEPGFELRLDKLREFHFLDVGARGHLRPGFYDCFFKAAQNLEKVSFGVKDYREDYEQLYPRPDECVDYEHIWHPMEVWDPLFEKERSGRRDLNVVLKSLLNYGRLDGIKSLTFHNLNQINLDTLVDIGNKGLKLDTFRVKGRIGFDPNSFKPFLETQKESLKTLEVSVENDPLRGLGLGFPSHMKELRRLILTNKGPLEIEKPICYSSRFPKMRTLHVQSGHRMRRYRQDVGILDTFFFFPELENFVGCETMKELRMDFILSDQEPRIKEIIQQRVSELFPKMTIRVQVHRDEDDQILEENARARAMTLKIYGD